MKEWITSFFYFSRKERIGACFMLLVISCIWLLPILFKDQKPDPVIVGKAEQIILQNQSVNYKQQEARVEIEMIYFDPNILPDSGWKQLGVHDKVIRTVKKFLGKGGRFRTPEDLRRIYGLHKNDADRLIPYVRIKRVPDKKYGEYRKNVRSKVSMEFPKKRWINSYNYKSYQSDLKIVDLNSADTSDLIALPGIGSKLAKRIIDFRDHAGGFYSIEQLADIYGLQDSIIWKLKNYVVISGEVRKLNINQISLDSLAIHPYISKNQARTIIQFRQMHGLFENMEKLKMVHNLDQATLEKMRNYLKF